MSAGIRQLADGKIACECGTTDWTQFLYVCMGDTTIAGCKKCGRTYLLKNNVWELKGGPA